MMLIILVALALVIYSNLLKRRFNPETLELYYKISLNE